MIFFLEELKDISKELKNTSEVHIYSVLGFFFPPLIYILNRDSLNVQYMLSARDKVVRQIYYFSLNFCLFSMKKKL